MTAGPRNLVEFQEMFPDDHACWAHLRAVRWPEGFECPACGHRESSWLARRRLEQCRSCRRQTSVTAGTVLHGTRVALRIWFLAFFSVGRHKKGISALQFPRDTGLGSYQTAWTLLRKVRAALGEALSDFRAWCESEGQADLPASPETVARYLAASAKAGRSASTLGQRVAAIRWVHESQGFDSPTASQGVRATMAGDALGPHDGGAREEPPQLAFQ